jgi:hypothetical protein
MSTTKALERMSQLIAKGEAVLRTHRPHPPNVIGFPTLDQGAFAEWRTQVLACLRSVLGDGHVYTQDFEKQVTAGYIGVVKVGLGILNATKQDLEAGHLDEAPQRSLDQNPLVLIEQICSRFHVVAR